MNAFLEILDSKRPNVMSIKSYHYELDGGGRELIESQISKLKPNPLMLQIGCFLSGSVRRWLAFRSDLILVGVDPWNYNASVLLKKWLTQPNMAPTFDSLDDIDEFIMSVEHHGLYLSAEANAIEFKERYFPFQNLSPDALYELKNNDIEPDIIYIDADKKADDLKVAYELWPNAIICGDDYTWAKDQGYPMKVIVDTFAEENGFKLQVDRATWLLS